MKIIDKKKDYYDYLAGIWGIDNTKAFDRRGSINAAQDGKWQIEYPNMLDGDGRLTYVFWVGSKIFIIWYEKKNEVWRFTDKLEDYSRWFTPVRHYKDNPIEVLVMNRESTNWYRRNKEIICNIGNVILKDFKIFTKYVNPEVIWNELYEYFGKLKDVEINDTRSDIQKLESAGFDRKTSFRNM